MQLQYPDLSTPPTGWTFGKSGHAIRLVPPGATFDHARAAIVVSPLVPASPKIPQPEELIRQALAAEVAQRGLEIAHTSEAEPFTTESGLAGVRLEAEVRHAGSSTIERRAYVMCRDDKWIYGLTYIADEQTWPALIETFDAAARSIQPAPGAGP